MACFLCLTENKNDVDCDGDVNGVKLSLAVIFKHLQLNLSTVGPQTQLVKQQRAVNNNYLLGEVAGAVDEEVYLCGRCSEISKNLTGLYEELDAINKKLNSSLSLFEGQIKFRQEQEINQDEDEKEDRKNDNQVGGRRKEQEILKRKAKEQCKNKYYYF